MHAKYPETIELVNEYKDLYDSNISRYTESLNRCTKALQHKPIDRIPVWQISQSSPFPRTEIFIDPEKNLMAALTKCTGSMKIASDYVPFLDPFEGVTIISEAFGCRTMYPDHGDPTVVEPIIKRAEDVYSLKRPTLKHPVFERIFATHQLWGEITGWEIPIGTTDPQSPLDVVSLMWETNNFYLSLYDNPKEIHFLLDMVTDVFIEFYAEQLKRIKNPAFPIHLFPLVSADDGIAISEDQMVNMSPGMYEEFGLKYLNKISDAFGGIYFHSCGNFERFLEQVFATKNLRAVNGHLSPKELNPQMIGTILDKGIGLFLGISDRTIGWENPAWEDDRILDMYNSYYLPSALNYSEGTGIVLTGYGSYRGYFDTETSQEEGQVIDGRGRPVSNDPLINVPAEVKNQNFHNILKRIDQLKTNKDSGIDILDTEKYRFFSR